MNVILLEPDELDSRRPDGWAAVRVDGPRATHLLTVINVTPGQRVRIGIVDGPLGSGAVTEVTGESVTLQCTFEEAPPPVPRVDLLLALPRPKVMRRLWAPLAALGVGRIILTNAARVERNYFDTHVLSREVYRALLIDGLQQARDTRLPAVTIHRQFRPLVEDDLDALAGDSYRLVADPRASASVTTLVRGRATENGAPGRVLVAIGPEGGWSEFELSLLDAHGFHRAALGPRTLRTDTACVALLALVNDALLAC